MTFGSATSRVLFRLIKKRGACEARNSSARLVFSSLSYITFSPCVGQKSIQKQPPMADLTPV